MTLTKAGSRTLSLRPVFLIFWDVLSDVCPCAIIVAPEFVARKTSFR